MNEYDTQNANTNLRDDSEIKHLRRRITREIVVLKTGKIINDNK